MPVACRAIADHEREKRGDKKINKERVKKIERRDTQQLSSLLANVTLRCRWLSLSLRASFPLSLSLQAFFG